MHLGFVIEGEAFVPWTHRSPFEGSPHGQDGLEATSVDHMLRNSSEEIITQLGFVQLGQYD